MDHAAKEFERRLTQLDQAVRRELRDSMAHPDFKNRLAEARETFKDNIVAADITGGEADEVIKLWEQAQAALEQDGFDGLMKRGRDVAREAHAARGKPNRGREPHSPLATWKYAIIAGAIVVGLASVVACFVWSACVWVVAAVGFLSGAASGWIIEMIKNGCAPVPA